MIQSQGYLTEITLPLNTGVYRKSLDCPPYY